jgi:hypothetical protein
MNKIKDIDHFYDNGLPLSQYYAQFETVKSLEVGKTYYQHAGTFWIHYKIIFIGEGVALGVEVANGNNNFSLGGKMLFHSEGLKLGWKYGDSRSVYRLRKEVN